MAFADVVRHGLDPRDAPESLLDARGGISVCCTAPQSYGKEEQRQIARKRV